MRFPRQGYPAQSVVLWFPPYENRVGFGTLCFPISGGRLLATNLRRFEIPTSRKKREKWGTPFLVAAGNSHNPVGQWLDDADLP